MTHQRDNVSASVFSAEWLVRQRTLSLASRRLQKTSILRTSSRMLPAGGTEAVAVRDYVPGDDPRLVDWKLCARRDEVLTRTYQCRADVPMTVLLDISRSMAGGQGAGGEGSGRSGLKFDLARQLAGVAGCVAIEAMTSFRLVPFSGRLCRGLPALRGKWQALRLLRFLERLEPDALPTDLAASAGAFVRWGVVRGPVLVISDLLDSRGFAHGLNALRHYGYEPRVVHLYASEDASPACLGDVELLDRETGTRQRAVITEKAIDRYRELFARFLTDVTDYCRRHAVPCLQLSTDTTPEDAMRALLGFPIGRQRTAGIG